jgi:hypothetical protein
LNEVRALQDANKRARQGRGRGRGSKSKNLT